MSDETLEHKDSPTLPIAQEKTSVIKNRYRIEKELGRGGMGVVFLAHDQELHNRPVVIKVLRDIAPGEWHTKKFRQEIEALVRIEHPGVVGVFDAGEMPNGQLFVVMQFVEGVTLRSIMNQGPMDFERAAGIIEQMGLALNAAHEKGVLHCDLKPENIMLQQLQRGQQIVKLIDFGIAKIRDSQVSSSHSTKIAGTIEYMSPEQMNGAPCVGSDIFSLGVIAYEMLAGQKPFPAQNLVQLVEMHRTGLTTRAKELCPGLPESVDPVLRKALEYDPRERYQNAADFTEELTKALRTDPGNTTVTSAAPAIVRQSRKKSPLFAYVTLALALAGIATFLLYYQSSVAKPIVKTRPAVFVRLRATPSVASRQLNYSIRVQKANQKDVVTLAEGINFQPGDRIQFQVRSAQAGHLYVLNEGPQSQNGVPDYVIQYPSPLENNKWVEIAENQQVRIPMKFDQEKGTEKLWIISAKSAIPELEAVKEFATPKWRGEIKDDPRALLISKFLQQSAESKTEVIRNDENHETVCKSHNDVLVCQCLLQHN